MQWQPLIIALSLLFLYAGVLVRLGKNWWTDENYSHGLLVPFVIGFIIWMEFDELKKVRQVASVWLGGSIVVGAFLMFLAGTLSAELFTQRVSFFLMLIGVIVYFFGTKIIRLLVVPFVLLLLAIPIPQVIFNKIAFPLQIWASQAAVWGIRLVDVPTVRKGNVIEILPNGATQIIALEVVEACSGIRSLMTLMTLALILAYFTRVKRELAANGWLDFLKNYDVWRAVILMLSAIPIAVLTNAARVTATGVLTYYYGKQATESTLHEILGWSVYVVALGLLFGVNLLLKKFQISNFKFQTEIEAAEMNSEIEIDGRKDEQKNDNQETGKIATFHFLPLPVIALIILLFTGGIFINWFERRGEAETARKPLAELPQTLGDWRQKGDEMRFGEQTESVLRVTDYTQREYLLPDNRSGNLYVGYYASQRSGATYHSPQNCLPGAGWTMREPQTIEIKTPHGKVFTANRYRVENGVYDAIMIYWYQGRGRTEANEYRDKINTIWDSVTRRRTDGALVRVMTSVGNDEQHASKDAIDLSAQLADQLDEFVPQ